MMLRTITICDSFDAMSQNRPYQKNMSIDQAIIEVQNNAGRKFDSNPTKIFIDHIIC